MLWPQCTCSYHAATVDDMSCKAMHLSHLLHLQWRSTGTAVNCLMVVHATSMMLCFGRTHGTVCSLSSHRTRVLRASSLSSWLRRTLRPWKTTRSLYRSAVQLLVCITTHAWQASVQAEVLTGCGMSKGGLSVAILNMHCGRFAAACLTRKCTVTQTGVTKHATHAPARS